MNWRTPLSRIRVMRFNCIRCGGGFVAEPPEDLRDCVLCVQCLMVDHALEVRARGQQGRHVY